MTGLDLHSPEWRERVIDDALRAGRITLTSAPEWRRRLAKNQAGTEATLASLAAVPSVGQANVGAMAA